MTNLKLRGQHKIHWGSGNLNIKLKLSTFLLALGIVLNIVEFWLLNDYLAKGSGWGNVGAGLPWIISILVLLAGLAFGLIEK